MGIVQAKFGRIGDARDIYDFLSPPEALEV